MRRFTGWMVGMVVIGGLSLVSQAHAQLAAFNLQCVAQARAHIVVEVQAERGTWSFDNVCRGGVSGGQALEPWPEAELAAFGPVRQVEVVATVVSGGLPRKTDRVLYRTRTGFVQFQEIVGGTGGMDGIAVLLSLP